MGKRKLVSYTLSNGRRECRYVMRVQDGYSICNSSGTRDARFPRCETLEDVTRVIAEWPWLPWQIPTFHRIPLVRA